MPAAIAGLVWLERRRAARAAGWSTPALLPNMVTGDPGRRRLLPVALFLAGLTLLLVGFARPEAKISEPREGATVVLAVDVSGSMAATDVKPSRLAAADAALTQFLKDLPSKYRVSLVTFSNRPTVRVPPTYDRQVVIQALPKKAELEATDLGDGAIMALNVATKAVGKSQPGLPRPPATVLLLSDGNQNCDRCATPQQAAAQAQKVSVPISTVSLGTPDGVVLQKIQGGYTERRAVPTAPAQLQSLAQGSGGRFFKAATATQLQQVYKDLGSRLAHEKKKREITTWVTMGALGFILGGALLSGLWFRRLV